MPVVTGVTPTTNYGGSTVALSRRIGLLAVGTATAVIGTLAVPAVSMAASLGTPTSLAPDNSSSDINDPSTWQKDPVLSWSPVTGASGYDVELSNSNDFTDATNLWTLPNSGHVSGPALALPQPLDHGAYYWRVRATTDAVNGTWSAPAELFRGWDDAPGASPNAVPNDNRVNGTMPWRFSWSAIPDASSYEIEFSTFPTFPADPKDSGAQAAKWNDGKTTLDCLTTRTTFTPYTSVGAADAGVDTCDFSGFDPDKTPVFWRVRGVDDSQDAVPAGPQTQTLDCFGTPQSSSSASPDPAANTPAALGTPASPSHECSLWSATNSVAWPVSDSGSDPTTYGPIGVSLTNCGAPAIASTGSTPATYSCTDTPEITWSPVSDAGGKFASNYMVTIADDPAFSNIERVYNTTFLSLTPRDEFRDFTAGRGYYVEVAACGDNGGSCSSSEIVTFLKRTPRIAGVSAVHLNGAERFSWQDLLGKYPNAGTVGGAATEAEHYLLQIADSSDTDFATPVASLSVDRACDSSLALPCYNPSGSTVAGDGEAVVHVADGSYIWRVVPVDRAGNHLPASTPLAVTVDTTAPQLSLTTKSGIAVNSPLTMKSSEAVIGVSAATVELTAVAGGAPVPVSVALGAAANTWTLTPTHKLVTGQRYALHLIGNVHDAANNTAVVVGGAVRTTTIADDRSVAWTWPSGWARASSSNAIGGTFERATSGHTVSLALAGSTVYVYGCKGPTLGSLVVKLDGVKKATVSEHQSFTKCGLLVWTGSVTTSAQHVLNLTTVGTATVDEVKVA
ncbi:MAG: hypothetical protein QOD07_1505 [Frankiaceae bacterium]|jgi:hypothetical protein|nr:hypothetical protein [Frankiaceae bacterium]